MLYLTGCRRGDKLLGLVGFLGYVGVREAFGRASWSWIVGFGSVRGTRLGAGWIGVFFGGVVILLVGTGAVILYPIGCRRCGTVLDLVIIVG